MNASHNEEARHLLKIAERDIRAFEWLKRGGEDFSVSALFYAQQAVEKCLKAAAVLSGLQVPRTHSLQLLVEMLIEANVQPPFSASELSQLTPYAVTMRYDDDDDLVTLNYTDATRFVEEVYHWAKGLVEEKK